MAIRRPGLIGAHDGIRVVPLYVADDVFKPTDAAAAAQPAVPPQLTYRGGPLLTKVKVFTAFWGTQWNNAPLSATMTSMNAFFKDILQSSLLGQLAEYKAGAQTIGNGSLIGTTVISTPLPGHSIADSAIQHMLQQEIATNAAFPQPDANTLYFLYLPPGTRAIQGGSRSCTGFCGYHDAVGGQLFYAVMPYPNCNGCLGGLAALDALTSTSSHELCEAITDAVPGQGWYDDNNGEIGDICAWQTKKVTQGGQTYTVQLEWSNAQNKCM